MASFERYTRTAVVLHWLIAGLLLAECAHGWWMQQIPKQPPGIRADAFNQHKSVGLVLLALVLIRLGWRLAHRPPTLPAVPRWQSLAAKANHVLLYAMMIALPLSGWMHDSAWKAAATHPMHLFGVIPFPRIGFIMNLDPAVKEPLHDRFGPLHTYLGYALYALLAMHIGGALKHELFDRHSVIKRMVP